VDPKEKMFSFFQTIEIMGTIEVKKRQKGKRFTIWQVYDIRKKR